MRIIYSQFFKMFKKDFFLCVKHATDKIRVIKGEN